MRVLCASVLGLEVIVVLCATALASSTGSVSSVALAWTAGLILMALLIVGAGSLGRSWGITFGWILQALVLLTSFAVGWMMLVVGVIFTVLWYFAVHLGTRVDASRAK